MAATSETLDANFNSMGAADAGAVEPKNSAIIIANTRIEALINLRIFSFCIDIPSFKSIIERPFDQFLTIPHRLTSLSEHGVGGARGGAQINPFVNMKVAKR
jgi:hypothetical protein